MHPATVFREHVQPFEFRWAVQLDSSGQTSTSLPMLTVSFGGSPK
jgi:hypothetical protein